MNAAIALCQSLLLFFALATTANAQQQVKQEVELIAGSWGTLEKSSSVVRATHNAPVNDPLFPLQESLVRIGLPQLWQERGLSVSQGAGNTPVVDWGTGIGDHIDLKGRVDCNLSQDFIKVGGGACVDEFGHDTGITAGFANGNDGVGMTGLNWSAPIISFKVISVETDSAGNRNTVSSLAAVIAAARATLELPHKTVVVNASLGVRVQSPTYSAAIKALEHKALIVAAGDNAPSVNSATNPTYPCYESELPHVICISSITRQGSLWLGSSFGSRLNLTAPGDGIIAGFPGDGFGYMTGNSVAAFVVSAAAIMAIEYAASKGVDLTPAQLKQILLRGALFASGLVSPYGIWEIEKPRTLNLPRLFWAIDEFLKNPVGPRSTPEPMLVDSPSTEDGTVLISQSGQRFLTVGTLRLTGRRLTDRVQVFLNGMTLETVCLNSQELSVKIGVEASIFTNNPGVLYYGVRGSDGEIDPSTVEKILYPVSVRR